MGRVGRPGREPPGRRYRRLWRLGAVADLPHVPQAGAVWRKGPDLRPRHRLLRVFAADVAGPAELRLWRAGCFARARRHHAPRHGRHRLQGDAPWRESRRRAARRGRPRRVRRSGLAVRPRPARRRAADPADRRQARRPCRGSPFGHPRGDLRGGRRRPAVPRLEPAVLHGRGPLRSRLHRRQDPPAAHLRDAGHRRAHSGGARVEHPAPPSVVAGRHRGVDRRRHRAARRRAGRVPVAHRQPEPAHQGTRVHRQQPGCHQERLQAQRHHARAARGQDAAHAAEAQRQPAHAEQHPPVGPQHPGDELPAAAGAAALLRLPRRRCGPLHRQRRLPPDDALAARAQHRRPPGAGADLGQSAHHLHARLRRGDVGGEPGDRRRLARFPRAGRAAAERRRASRSRSRASTTASAARATAS